MTPIDRHYSRGAVNCGRRFGEGAHAAYGLLGAIEPGLCIDVGAAIGQTLDRILAHNPLARVIAYEPFPGNLPYLARSARGRSQVTLRPVAVADRAGTERFVVGRTVKGDETPDAKKVRGYSPLGHLGGREGQRATLDVEVVTLDGEIREHVRFLKIDVQGSELRVLKGASRLIDEFGIDIVHVEFNGSYAALKFLRAKRYVLFDCAYLAWPTRRYFRNWFRARPDRLVPSWPIIDQGPSPMALHQALTWPRVPVRSFGFYCTWFFLNRLFRSGLQTDLLCVHEDFLSRFLKALDHA